MKTRRRHTANGEKQNQPFQLSFNALLKVPDLERVGVSLYAFSCKTDK